MVVKQGEHEKALARRDYHARCRLCGLVRAPCFQQLPLDASALVLLSLACGGLIAEAAIQHIATLRYFLFLLAVCLRESPQAY